MNTKSARASSCQSVSLTNTIYLGNFFSILILVTSCAQTPESPSFAFVDARSFRQREGLPYPHWPKSWIPHGDNSLGVDRLKLLHDRLTHQFGKKLNGETVTLHHFLIVEASLRNAFVTDSSGKRVPNTGPYALTISGELILSIGNRKNGEDCNVSFEIRLPDGAIPIHGDLHIATMGTIDACMKNLLENMARHDERNRHLRN